MPNALRAVDMIGRSPFFQAAGLAAMADILRSSFTQILPRGAGCAGLPKPRTAIAARLGMTPETLSRMLAGLEDTGELTRRKAGATVADRTALAVQD